MFTTVVDNAVARYTLPNGTEVAFGYDECALNPVEECRYPIGIQRDERNTIMTDPTGVLTEYYELTNRIEDLEAWCEWYRSVSDGEEPEDAMEEIAECREELKGITFLEWKDTIEYGNPNYHIAYRAEELIKDGWNADNLDSIVKSMAREYSAWANGSVYLMGIEVPGDEVEYVTCYAGFDPYDEEEVKDLIEDYVDSADGLQAA